MSYEFFEQIVLVIECAMFKANTVARDLTQTDFIAFGRIFENLQSPICASNQTLQTALVLYINATTRALGLCLLVRPLFGVVAFFVVETILT